MTSLKRVKYDKGGIIYGCLSSFIDHKHSSMAFVELVKSSYLKEYGMLDILETLKQLKCFFFVDETNESDKKVFVSIKLQACKSYNAFHTTCNNSNCDQLHICEHKLNSTVKCSCPLKHTLKTDFNRRLGEKNNFSALQSFTRLLNFYQVILTCLNDQSPYL
jgi:hypothetical protein